MDTAIDQTDDSATSRIFDSWPIPNQRMNAGTSVNVGTDSPTATIGSKNQRIALKRAMRTPSAMPIITAMAKPATARSTVTAASWISTPSTTCAQKVAAMIVNGGRKKNGTTPLRATISHAAATRTSE